MRKLILFFAVLISSSAFATPPIKGGYLGRRFIVAGEFAYSPNYYSVASFVTSYNPQFGGNIQYVCGRYWQVGLNFNKYILGDMAGYDIGNPKSSEKLTATSIGFTARKYRVKKGGLAPIGKFIEFGISQQKCAYNYEDRVYPSENSSVESTRITGTVAFGVQEIFKDRIVANCGVRFGGKLFTISETNTIIDTMYAWEIMNTRTAFHNAFTPFAGLGIIF